MTTTTTTTTSTTTTIEVPASCATLCTKLAELAQGIDDQLAQAAGGAVIDYGTLEQRVAEPLRTLMAELAQLTPEPYGISGHCRSACGQSPPAEALSRRLPLRPLEASCAPRPFSHA